MRGKVMLLMLLLVAGSVLAANFSEYASTLNGTIKQEGDAFVRATGAGVGTAGRVPGTFYDAFSPGFCGNDTTSASGGVGSALADLGTNILLVLIIIALVIVLLWMLAQVLQSPGLNVIAKDEAVQLFYTVLRILFVVGMFIAGNLWFTMKTSGITLEQDSIYGLRNAVNPAVGLSMIDSAMAFSRSMIVEMITTFSNLVLFNTIIHTLYTSTMWFGVTWRVQYSFNLGPVLKPLVDIVGMALQFLSLGISEWMLHLITLCMIKRWTWTLFIPLSILMRSIPQTRGAGEALFAIAFALAIVYPFMFLVSYETHKLLKNNIIDDSSAVNSFIQKSGILAIAGSVLVLMFLMAGVFFPFFIGMAMNLAFELIRNAIYYSVILSLLLPFLNIFITLTAAREIAKFFDVDVSFMSFIKVI